jgi:hypothetical protein
MIPRKTSKTIPFLNSVRRRWSKHRSEEEGERAGGEETGGGAEGREALYLERRLFSLSTQSISPLHYLSSFLASKKGQREHHRATVFRLQRNVSRHTKITTTNLFNPLFQDRTPNEIRGSLLLLFKSRNQNSPEPSLALDHALVRLANVIERVALNLALDARLLGKLEGVLGVVGRSAGPTSDGQSLLDERHAGDSEVVGNWMKRKIGGESEGMPVREGQRKDALARMRRVPLTASP